MCFGVTIDPARQTAELRPLAQVPRQRPLVGCYRDGKPLSMQLAPDLAASGTLPGRKVMERPYQPLSHHHALQLAAHASRMRSALTPSEEALWSELSGGKIGVTFRRQYVIVRFISDFAAPSVKLVVETDGGYHAHRAFADASRDRKLQRLGVESHSP